MKTSFLFVDDWSSNEIDKFGTTMSALTGILIPVDDYADLRHRYYALQRKWINLAPNTVANPPELHGSEMLKDASDEEKLAAYSMIAKFIVENKIQIVRIGQYVTHGLRDMLKGTELIRVDPKFLNSCWFHMLWELQPYYEKECIIPVMDTCNAEVVPMFSAMVRQMDIMRAADERETVSIKNSENILGEVFYADSRFAAFIQTVDVAGYLRGVVDLHRNRWAFSPFKEKVLEIAQILEPAIAIEKIFVVHMTNKDGTKTVHAPRFDED